MPNKTPLLVIALALLSGVASAGAAQGCSAPQEPVRVSGSTAPVETVPANSTLSYRQLSTMAGDEVPGNGWVFGLARTKVWHAYRTGIRFGVTPQGEPCARLAELEYQLGLEPVKVYAARELSGLSCLTGYVLEHEGEHVQLYRKLLAQGDAGHQTAMEQLARETPFVVASDKARLHDEMDRVVASRIRPIVQEREKQLYQGQTDFDGHTDWYAETRHCGTEVPALFKRVGE